jgi:DNA-binding PadR family transcriptional regulator
VSRRPTEYEGRLLRALRFKPAYQVELIARVRRMVGMELREGTVSNRLHAMEKRGWVKREECSRAGHGSGNARVYCRITELGAERLSELEREVPA